MELVLTSTTETPMECIRNGMIVDGFGHRAVAFKVDEKTKGVTIRNVISQKTKEKIHGWNASIQTLRLGDYVIMSSWYGKHKKIQMLQNTKNGLRPSRTNGGSVNSILIPRLPKAIIEFLNPREGGPSYLPSGYWRSKYDMYTSVNKEEIEKFLKPYLDEKWLQYTVEQAAKVPFQHLIMDWNSIHVKPLPKSIENHMEYWVLDDYTDKPVVHNSMIWVLKHTDGTIEIREPQPTSGHYYRGPTRRISETFTDAPKGMPNTVEQAIRINLGAYEKNDTSYGARWFLYKR